MWLSRKYAIMHEFQIEKQVHTTDGESLIHQTELVTFQRSSDAIQIPHSYNECSI